MKKLIVLGAFASFLASPVFAQEAQAYLTDGSSAVVKSGFGFCWTTSGPKVPNVECGDVIEKPKAAIPVAPAPVAKVEAPKIVKAEKVVISAEVLFRFDSAVLSIEGRELLKEKVLGLNPIEVEVHGHTDRIGSEKYNQALSERRADAVRTYLIAQGLNKEVVKAQGFGETKLLCKDVTSSKNSACNVQNRRVEIVTSYMK